MRNKNMKESKGREGATAETKTSGGLAGDERGRRMAIYAGVLLVAFLLGLVPMWLAAHERGRERDRAQTELRVSRLQNALANAAVDARRGEYEPARQSASEFYTKLRGEIERENDSPFTTRQRETLRSLLDNRDDTITLLARSDAAPGERLAEVYAVFRHAVGDNFAASASP